LLAAVAPILRRLLPGKKIGGGTDANFTEFNRNPFSYDAVDFVVFSINPQVHAFDDLSLIENVAAQGDVVRTAYHITRQKPVHTSPVTLKPRFNAVATSGTASKRAADERQTTPFCGAWTLGSLKYLLEAGAASITYFETFGPGGIAAEDRLYPVGVLLTYILHWKPQYVVTTVCNEPLRVSSLLLEKRGEFLLLIANHTGEPLKVTLPQVVEEMQIGHLGEKKDSAFDHSTGLLLQPHEIVTITGAGNGDH
jgi:hypothetical protein